MVFSIEVKSMSSWDLCRTKTSQAKCTLCPHPNFSVILIMVFQSTRGSLGGVSHVLVSVSDCLLGKLLDIGAGDGGVTDKLVPLFDEIHVTEYSRVMRFRLWRKGFKYTEPCSCFVNISQGNGARRLYQQCWRCKV